jgi:hypothetical protein
MNLLLFTLMGMLAVRKTPIGKELILSFPVSMVLELVSSLSYDTYILALGFYLTATILELALSDRRSAGRMLRRSVLLAVLLSPCKMVYCVLFAACLIIPAPEMEKSGILSCNNRIDRGADRPVDRSCQFQSVLPLCGLERYYGNGSRVGRRRCCRGKPISNGNAEDACDFS